MTATTCCRTPSRFPTWGSAPMPGSGICSSATCWAWPPSRRRARQPGRAVVVRGLCAAVLRLPHVHHVPGHLPGGGAVLFFGVLLACWAILNTIVMPLWRLARQLFTDPQIQARRGGPMPSPRSACWRRPDWRAPCPCRPRPIPRAWSGCRRWPRCARRWPASSASARRRTMRSWRRARRCWRWRTTNCSGATPCWPPRSTSTRRATCRRMPRIRCRPPSRAINGRAC